MDLSDNIGLAFFTIMLTLLTNLFFKWLQNKFDFMVDTKKFKREYYYKQLNELYFEIYSIVISSEFLRNLYKVDETQDLSEIPFIELQRRIKKVKQDLFTGKVLEESEETVESALSNFNKIGLVNRVLEKKAFASPNLLKLAVGYSYLHENYQKTTMDPERLETIQTKELFFIYQIVTMVVKEFNQKMKYCKMDYSKAELKEGRMDNGVFDGKS